MFWFSSPILKVVWCHFWSRWSFNLFSHLSLIELTGSNCSLIFFDWKTNLKFNFLVRKENFWKIRCSKWKPGTYGIDNQRFVTDFISLIITNHLCGIHSFRNSKCSPALLLDVVRCDVELSMLMNGEGIHDRFNRIRNSRWIICWISQERCYKLSSCHWLIDTAVELKHKKLCCYVVYHNVEI